MSEMRSPSLLEPGKDFSSAMQVARVAIDEVARHLRVRIAEGRGYTTRQMRERKELVTDVMEAKKLGIKIYVENHRVSSLAFRGVSLAWVLAAGTARGFKSNYALILRTPSDIKAPYLCRDFAKAAIAANLAVDEVAGHLEKHLTDGRSISHTELDARQELMADVERAMDIGLSITIDGVRAHQLVMHESNLVWSMTNKTSRGFHNTDVNVVRRYPSIYGEGSPLELSPG